jgi:hypothetical protein
VTNSMGFHEVDAQTFEAARKAAVQQACERAPLTQAEFTEGWREDPASGLRRSMVSGEWDDGCFLHLAPKRPS